jgi:HPt (histidine-containing phosphotransfer) domain-containing protein
MGGETAARFVDISRGASHEDAGITRPIDMAFLHRQTLNDPGLELEILRLFDEMSRTYYDRLEHSTTVDDLLRNLHTLKGAAAGVGAFGLAELARVTERELSEGAPVNPERIDDLAIAVQEVSAFIAQRISLAA